jgi:CHAT domain-containing protein/tetratricopeptide (TPR) repeat protein
MNAFWLLALAQSTLTAANEGLLSEELKSQARYQEALSHAEAGLRLLGHDPPQLLAKSYRTGGEAPIAPDVYECDRGAFEKLVESPNERELEACLLMNAAGLYLRQVQLDSARAYYERALEVTGDRKAEIRTNLAWLEILDRRPDEAARRVGSLAEDSPPRSFLVSGVVLRETGRPEQALPLLRKASALYEESRDFRGLARSLAHLGTLHLEAARLDDARASYEGALRLAEESGDVEARWHALGGLAASLEKLGDGAAALRHYEKYLEVVNELGASFATDQGKVSFLSNHQRVLDDYFHLLVLDAAARGRIEEARAEIEAVRARALGSLLASWRPRGQPGELDLPGMLPGSGFRSSNFANMMVQAAPAVVSGPAAVTDEPLDEPPVMEGAPPPITFLEYFSFPDITVVFVKSKDGRVSGTTVPAGVAMLQERVEAFRSALRVPTPRGVAVVGEKTERPEDLERELYRLLVQPIEASLPPDPDEVVAIVPHGPLWYLPFAALRRDDGSFFIDRHLLTTAASEESWLFTARRARPDPRELRAWVVGNPRMPSSLSACGDEMAFEPLPGAEQEAVRIAEILGSDRAELFLGKNADRLRLEAWHGDFSVIHLATHGVVCGWDPLESFLVLSDLAPEDVRFDSATAVLSIPSDPRRSIRIRGEGLEELEVSNLNLSGVLTAGRVIDGFRLNADLVSLSACQTGLGLLSSEGIIGFSRAFLAAGARSLLMSLWRIDDEASRDWMIAFYEAYSSHANKAKALREAMDRTRERYPDPRYWAGFGLLGLAE